MKRFLGQMSLLAACLLAWGCVTQPPENRPAANSNSSPSASATVSPSPVVELTAPAQPLTLPVLDAFFADDSFARVVEDAPTVDRRSDHEA